MRNLNLHVIVLSDSIICSFKSQSFISDLFAGRLAGPKRNICSLFPTIASAAFTRPHQNIIEESATTEVLYWKTDFYDLASPYRLYTHSFQLGKKNGNQLSISPILAELSFEDDTSQRRAQ